MSNVLGGAAHATHEHGAWLNGEPASRAEVNRARMKHSAEKDLVEQVYTNAIDSLSEDDRMLPQIEHMLPLLKLLDDSEKFRSSMCTNVIFSSSIII